jgi:hypothetical protein
LRHEDLFKRRAWALGCVFFRFSLFLHFFIIIFLAPHKEIFDEPWHFRLVQLQLLAQWKSFLFTPPPAAVVNNNSKQRRGW